jgi:hypothetical protein
MTEIKRLDDLDVICSAYPLHKILSLFGWY